MSTFEPFADSPFQIKREGEEITVTQTRLSPTSIRISWTLPQSVSCNMPSAYNGAIVTVDRTPTNTTKWPMDGSVYTADPSANIDLNAGSRLGTSLVVGAFYDDKITQSVDVLDAPASESFYATVHAVDNVHRYHTDGVFSYALPYGKKEDVATPGYQTIDYCVSPVNNATVTGLDPLISYTFTVCVDNDDPILITIDGATAQTFGDLIVALNLAFVNLYAPVSSTDQPFLNVYWYDAVNKLLYQFDGKTYILQTKTIILGTDPLLPVIGSYWVNSTTDTLYQWSGTGYVALDVWKLGRDPRNPYCNDFWFDGTALHKWNGGVWVLQALISSNRDPQLAPIMDCTKFWYSAGILNKWNHKTCKWEAVPIVLTQPTLPSSGDIWFDTSTSTVHMWNDVDSTWVGFPVTTIDPSLPRVLPQEVVWLDTIVNKFYVLDGTSWVPIVPLIGNGKPQNIPNGSIWKNLTDGVWYTSQMGAWQPLVVLEYPTQPNIPVEGSFWVQPGNIVSQFVSGVWTPIIAPTTKQLPVVGSYWYNPTDLSVKHWTGSNWNVVAPKIIASITKQGNIQLTSSTLGSKSWVYISDMGTLWATASTLQYTGIIEPGNKGYDPVSTLPSYATIGVGTDGSQDERRNLIEVIKTVLGYPAVSIELTKRAMDTAINMALEKLRSASSVGYRRAYFPLDLRPRQQKYKLTDMTVGFNKIAEVLYIYRQSASFLGTAAGNGVYGQMMVQNLFNMGKFDLLSYHMVSSYVETMNQLFASEIQFTWEEYSRTLTIFKDFPRHERVLVDAMIERTEQDLLTDRWTKNWIQVYATAQCRYMLADIRGKFGSLPGAGGNITLNASDLRTKADTEVQQCMEDIDNYVVNNKTDVGMGADFVFG